jgi:ABC-type antimicrobial peptide transport system permease subunit
MEILKYIGVGILGIVVFIFFCFVVGYITNKINSRSTDFERNVETGWEILGDFFWVIFLIALFFVLLGCIGFIILTIFDVAL